MSRYAALCEWDLTIKQWQYALERNVHVRVFFKVSLEVCRSLAEFCIFAFRCSAIPVGGIYMYMVSVGFSASRVSACCILTPSLVQIMACLLLGANHNITHDLLIVEWTLSSKKGNATTARIWFNRFIFILLMHTIYWWCIYEKIWQNETLQIRYLTCYW